MPQIVALTGNEAVAEAMRQINPDVVAAYPITPQTELMHKFAEYAADGIVSTELVLVESEHSAMSATLGASAAGSRAMTATSSQGLALMWEVCYITAALRLPIVMPVINRALSGPINIHCDHSDTMGCRDSGWLQFFSENSQEGYDNTIMAMKVAEHPNVLLPAMVTLDGFIISHTMERLEILDDNIVKNFVGEYHPKHSLLVTDKPISIGPLDLQDYYFEHKRQQAEAQDNAYHVIEQVAEEFERISGRKYSLIEEYRMNDAETAIIVLASTAGTTKVVVDRLRSQGRKVGMIKIRVYRPFPNKELCRALSRTKAVAVLDRSLAFGNTGGPVFIEVRSALYGGGFSLKQVKLVDYVYGLGGRDINLRQIEAVYDELDTIVSTGRLEKEVNYLGVRGGDRPETILALEEAVQ
jgi:pyruvate ferredoxin oxidoreductase alpha subunit